MLETLVAMLLGMVVEDDELGDGVPSPRLHLPRLDLENQPIWGFDGDGARLGSGGFLYQTNQAAGRIQRVDGFRQRFSQDR